jgi:hypothetical protein
MSHLSHGFVTALLLSQPAPALAQANPASEGAAPSVPAAAPADPAAPPEAAPTHIDAKPMTRRPRRLRPRARTQSAIRPARPGLGFEPCRPSRSASALSKR